MLERRKPLTALQSSVLKVITAENGDATIYSIRQATEINLHRLGQILEALEKKEYAQLYGANCWRRRTHHDDHSW